MYTSLILSVNLKRSRQRTIENVAEMKSYNGVLWWTWPEPLTNFKKSPKIVWIYLKVDTATSKVLIL